MSGLQLKGAAEGQRTSAGVSEPLSAVLNQDPPITSQPHTRPEQEGPN